MVFLLHYQQSSKQCISTVLESQCLYFFPCFNALLPLERIYHKIWHEVEKYVIETDTTYVHETCIVCSLDWWKSLESQCQIWKVWCDLKHCCSRIRKHFLPIEMTISCILCMFIFLTVIDNFGDCLKWTTTFR